MNKPRQLPQQQRLSPPVRKAIRSMVLEGMSDTQAALHHGCKLHTLQRALSRDVGKRLYFQHFKELRQSSVTKAIITAHEIMSDTGNSASARMDAAKWLAGLEGETVVQKSTVAVSVAGYDYSDVISDRQADTISADDAEIIEENQGDSD